MLTFLDTRGLDEPGYDPAEDLAHFNDRAHVLLVTVKAMDHAQENVLRHLRTIRRAERYRPVLLVLTCLHEAYPQQQHPLPYPFSAEGEPLADPPALPADLIRSLAEQRRRFAGLVDRVVAVDLTPIEEGFNDPDYGGPLLRQILLELLPAGFRQTLTLSGRCQPRVAGFFRTAGATAHPRLQYARRQRRRPAGSLSSISSSYPAFSRGWSITWRNSMGNR